MRRCFVVLVVLLVAVSAASGLVLHPASPVAERRSVIVGAGQSGSVLLSGAALALPEGAIDQEVRLSISRPRLHVPVLDSSNPLTQLLHKRMGPAVRLEASVDPSTLTKPLRVTVPLPAPAPPGSPAVIAYSSATGWHTAEATVDPSGTSASADVHHLSDWGIPDIIGFARELFDWLAKSAGLRTAPPNCPVPSGLTVLDQATGDDPLAYWCARPAHDGDGYVVVATSNRGVPLLVRPSESLRLMTSPSVTGLVDGVMRELYARGNIVLIPAGESVEFHYRPSVGPAKVTFEPTVASAVVDVLMRRLRRTPAGLVADALVRVLDCTRGIAAGTLSPADILDKCLGGLGVLGEQVELDLPHGIVTTLRGLRHFFGVRDAVASLDSLLDRFGLLGRSPTFFEIGPPPPTKPPPPPPVDPGVRVARTKAEQAKARARVRQVTGRAPAHGTVVVGCH